jgi:hypothetical protein
MRTSTAHVADAVVARPTIFEVGAHKVTVAKIQEGRWSVSVDQLPVDRTFQTQADAWEAGVREILRLGGLPKT